MKKDTIEIYTDGACPGNQFENSKGGWGAVLLFNDKKKEIKGGEENTTNNRMEMTAVIKALESLKRTDLPVIVHSDSAYIVNCFKQGWYKNWVRNGWKNSKKNEVENRDLWERLLELYEKFDVKFNKVKGHAGIEYNERADQLANLGAGKNV